MLRRKLMDKLVEWKDDPNKKGLIVTGARQVGKSYLVEHFGKEHYDNYLCINFSDENTTDIFRDNTDAATIVREIRLRYKDFIIEKNKSLLFLDEIQLCPNARSAIKALVNNSDLDIIASGSLLGTMGLKRTDGKGSYWDPLEWLSVTVKKMDDVGEPDEFEVSAKDPTEYIKKSLTEGSVKLKPVGYEQVIEMYPMDFEEYLWAINVSEEDTDRIRENIRNKKGFTEATLNTLNRYFDQYLTVGGMPLAVLDSISSPRSGASLIDIQTNIMNWYRSDVIDYAPIEIKEKVRMCLLSIPKQLGKRRKKFSYTDVDGQPNNGWRDYLEPISWLESVGIAQVCECLSEPVMPLKNHINRHFKIYLSDTGLLMCGMEVGVRVAISGGDYSINKGGIIENAVANMIERCGLELFYFERNKRYEKKDGSMAVDRIEIDFIANFDGRIAAIEVKSGNNRRASSLRKLMTDERYSMYRISRFIKLEKSNIFVDENGVEHYPIFAAAFMDSMFEKNTIAYVKSEGPLEF